MKPTKRVPSRVSLSARLALPGEASHEIDWDEIDGNAMAGFLECVPGCDPEAYQDLYVRLKRFRRYFMRHVFSDPESAYREFVAELVDQVHDGLPPNRDVLWAQARATVLRKASDRIQCLTMAARVLSTLPKRHREILIRAQSAFYSSAHALRDCRETELQPAAVA
jgi:hypothetical protein